jgi:hypothetical protein
LVLVNALALMDKLELAVPRFTNKLANPVFGKHHQEALVSLNSRG